MKNSNPEIFLQLGPLLRRRLEIIADHALRDSDPEAQMRQLRAVSEEISRVQEQHQTSLPPRLNHFLQQASFAKALEFIERAGA